MKKLMMFGALLASVALGADYLLGAELQTGAGTNGMTRAAPTLATEGVAVVTPKTAFIGDKLVATKAKVSIRASGSNVFQNAADISWLRCYHYGMDPRDSTGATFAWKRCNSMDMAVDAGSGVPFANTLEFPPQNLGVERSGNRYLWACENCQQSTALDGGVAVSIEMIAPN